MSLLIDLDPSALFKILDKLKEREKGIKEKRKKGKGRRDIIKRERDTKKRETR